METFDEIITGDKPVLVDFYATWCGPCRTMSPIIDEVGKEMQGEVRVIKIDIDRNRSVADRYQIQAVPTLVIFRNGRIVWRNAGAVDKMSLLKQIKISLG
jgi:thioredoxin 1